jgi:hypothetical protein
MSLTASEAKERALQKMDDLRRLSKELCAIMDELPLPSPEEFPGVARCIQGNTVSFFRRNASPLSP